MDQRIRLTLLGIILTVFPSYFCFGTAGVLSLSKNEKTSEIILIMLPAMILVGGAVGLGTSLILPNKWLVIVGAELGWVIGLLAAGLVANVLQLSATDRESPILWGILIPVCGLLPGLLPAFIAVSYRRRS